MAHTPTLKPAEEAVSLLIDLASLILGMILAVLGGAGYVLFWEEYEPKKAGRHLALAGIAGVVYSILRVEYGYPDLIVTIVVGWFAPDFIQSIVQRFKPETPVPAQAEK